MNPRATLRAVPLAAGCLFAALTGCKPKAPPPPIPASQYAIEAPKPADYIKPVGGFSERLTLTDITAEAGLRYEHVTGAFGKKWMPETMGGGGGFFDYDGDNFADILLINSDYWPGRTDGKPAPQSRLFRNLRDGTFEDVTAASGLATVRCYGMGFSAADYDGDNDADLYITAVGRNCLLRNERGKFTDVTDAAGVGFSTCDGPASPWEWSTGCTWLDADRDGDLDLFVCHYVKWTPETDIWATRDGKNKAYATPERYQGATNVLFRNNGEGTFSDVTKAAGVHNPEGKSLGVIAEDFNDDGWLDLFVANDTQPNFMYINQRDGTFVDKALAFGVAYDEAGLTRAGMGVDVADLTNSGKCSIVVGNFSGEPVSLFEQEGPGTFVDHSGRARLTRPTTLSLTFGAVFADFNLDGSCDLLLANGHIEPEIESVKQEWKFAQPPQLFLNDRRGQFVEVTTSAGASFREPIVGRAAAVADVDGDGDLDALLTSNGGPAKLLRNDLEVRTTAAVETTDSGAYMAGSTYNARQPAKGAGDSTARAGTAPVTGGMESGDNTKLASLSTGQLPTSTDADKSGGSPPRAARRDGASAERDGAATPSGGAAARVVRVRLVSDGMNREAIGARLRATSGGVTQTRTIRTGGSYLSQSELIATFGLPAAKQIDKLAIRWPDGTEESVGPIPVGQFVTIARGSGLQSGRPLGSK